MASKTENFNPRTARTPSPAEPKYVLVHGAPESYVDGYGVVRAGAIVSLAPGVTPGRWMLEVSPEDAAKAASSEADAQRLAVVARAKLDAEGRNPEQAQRKELHDKRVLAAQASVAQQEAQAQADAIKRAAEAEEKAKKHADDLATEQARANDLAEQLRVTQDQLAAAQKQAEQQQKKADDKKQ